MLLKFSAIPPFGGAIGQTVGGCDWTGFSAATAPLSALKPVLQLVTELVYLLDLLDPL